jgi:hypothetical protein
MSAGSPSRLSLLQRQYSDRLLSALTALLLLLIFVVAPLQAAGIIAFQAFGVVVMLAMIVGVLILSGNPVAFVLMMVAVSMNGVVLVLRTYGPTVLDLYLVAGAWLIVSLTLGWVSARAVFAAGRVTYHRIVGAVRLYLLIAMVFVSLFIFVGVTFESSFAGLKLEDNTALAANLFYFSFVTLTSTGYGDIVPVHPIARSLCNLETIIGQLYPATLLARLVSLELQGQH